ncbi:phage portal protein family protein [Dietzia maris]
MERGSAVGPKWSPLVEDNWDLRWPKSVRVYSKMAREDAQVKSVLKAVSLPILRTPCRISPNGADEAIVRMVSEDLRLPVVGDSQAHPTGRTGGKVAWREHLPWALKMLTYGHAYFEKVYTDGLDGPQRLRKLAPRMQDTISKISIDRDGGLRSITQKATSFDGKTVPEVELEVSRLLAYVHEPDTFDWLGTSILRPAYKHWRLKDEFLRLEQVVLERNGMGLPVYKSHSHNDQKDLDSGQELVEGLRFGENAGASISAEADLKLLGVTGQIVSPRAAIEYHDSHIARTALAHALNLEGKGGSYSLAEVQMDMFIQSLQTIAEYIATVANKYLVEDMVEKFTGDRVGPFPEIQFDTIDTKKALTPEGLAALKNAGLIFADRPTEEHLRRKYELPAKDFIPSSGDKPEDLKAKAEAAAALIDMGVGADEALRKVGLINDEGTPDGTA